MFSKKKFFIFLIFIFLFIGFFSFYYFKKNLEEICPFCSRKVIEYQKYFENDKIIGLYSFKPITAGHCLIIPKRHVETLELLKKEELEEIFLLIKKTHLTAKKIFDVKDYLILQKNGKSVGQSVRHLHFHYIPRKKDESSVAIFVMKFVMNLFRLKIPEEEMRYFTKAFSENIKDNPEKKINLFSKKSKW